MVDETPMTPEEIGAFKSALLTLMRRDDTFPGATFSHDDRWPGLPRNGVRIVRGALVVVFDGVTLRLHVKVAPNVTIRVGEEFGWWWNEARVILSDLQTKLMTGSHNHRLSRAEAVQSMRRAGANIASSAGA